MYRCLYIERLTICPSIHNLASNPSRNSMQAMILSETVVTVTISALNGILHQLCHKTRGFVLLLSQY